MAYMKIQTWFRVFSCLKWTTIWNKVFKNGRSEICGRQPLKILKGYGLPFTNFAWSILEYLAPFIVPSNVNGFQKSWNNFLSISVFYSNRENSVILWFYVLVMVEIDLFLDVLQCAVLFAGSLLKIIFGAKYSGMDQVEFAEGSL